MIYVIIVLLILINFVSFIVGWSFAYKFRSAHNFANFLQGKESWPTTTVRGHEGEAIYAKDIAEARALARKHHLTINI